METATPDPQGTENGGDQTTPTTTEPMEEVSNFHFIIYNYYVNKDAAPTNGTTPGSGDAQQEEKVIDLNIIIYLFD